MLSQWIKIGGIGFFHVKISYIKSCNQPTSSLVVTKALNSTSLVDLEMIDCFFFFQHIAPPSKVKT